MRRSLAGKRQRTVAEPAMLATVPADICAFDIYYELEALYRAFDKAKVAFRMTILAEGRDQQCQEAQELKTDDLDIVVLDNKD